LPQRLALRIGQLLTGNRIEPEAAVRFRAHRKMCRRDIAERPCGYLGCSASSSTEAAGGVAPASAVRVTTGAGGDAGGSAAVTGPAAVGERAGVGVNVGAADVSCTAGG
jgi:hypothetical protein